MNTDLISKYINEKRMQAGLTYDAVASISKIPESTVKNICTGKSDNPSISSLVPIMSAVGGSFDEMLNPEKSKDEIKETSVLAMKDIYEHQLSHIKETNERHIENIRAHYAQHHEDLKENYEKRLSDKRELNDSQKEQIADLKKSNLIKNLIIAGLATIFVVLFIMELMHPEHGWLRY